MHCQGITQFYLHTLRFIHKRNEPYLNLPSQPQLVLIHRPRRNGRLSKPWCEVAPAEIRTCNLPITSPALYHIATSAPSLLPCPWMDTTQNASTAIGALKYILTYLLTEFICLFIHNQRPHHGRTHYRGIFYSNIMWQNPLYRQHHSIVHDVLSISSVCTAPSLICFLRRRRRRRTTTTTTMTKMINYRPNQREAPTFSTGWGPHVVAAILSHQHFILCVCVCVCSVLVPVR